MKKILFILLLLSLCTYGCRDTVIQYVQKPAQPEISLLKNDGSVIQMNYSYISFNPAMDIIIIDGNPIRDLMKNYDMFSCYNKCCCKQLLKIQQTDSVYESYLFDSLYYVSSEKTIYWIFEGNKLQFTFPHLRTLNIFIDGK